MESFHLHSVKRRLALGVAVVSRMVFTAADVLAAGIAALSATRLARRRESMS